MSERLHLSRALVRSTFARGGLRFDRRADGAVLVWREAARHERIETYDGPQYRRIGVIPANEWASIVASLTASGEDASTHSIALALHTGGVAYDTGAHEHDTDLEAGSAK